MMRHQYSLVLGMATLFVLPGTLPGRQEPATLEQRLEATVEALAHLGGIEVTVQKRVGDPIADDFVIAKGKPDQQTNHTDDGCAD